MGKWSILAVIVVIALIVAIALPAAPGVPATRQDGAPTSAKPTLTIWWAQWDPAVGLQELGKDFDPVIRPKNNVQNVWDQLMVTFAEVGQLRPLFVIDGPPQATLFASHLAIQGFYLKRVILQLNEMSLVLRN